MPLPKLSQRPPATTFAASIAHSLGAILIEWGGAHAALAFLTGMAAVNIGLVGMLSATSRTAMPARP